MGALALSDYRIVVLVNHMVHCESHIVTQRTALYLNLVGLLVEWLLREWHTAGQIFWPRPCCCMSSVARSQSQTQGQTSWGWGQTFNREAYAKKWPRGHNNITIRTDWILFVYFGGVRLWYLIPFLHLISHISPSIHAVKHRHLYV